MKIMSVIPAAAASSTAYWISGLSTTGSISFGLALVTGRKRVPRPATGNTALVTLAIAIAILGVGDHGLQLLFVEHRNAELAGLVELAAGLGAGNDVRGLLRN